MTDAEIKQAIEDIQFFRDTRGNRFTRNKCPLIVWHPTRGWIIVHKNLSFTEIKDHESPSP